MVQTNVRIILKRLCHRWGKAKPKTTWTIEPVTYGYVIYESISLPNKSSVTGNKLEIMLQQLSWISYNKKKSIWVIWFISIFGIWGLQRDNESERAGHLYHINIIGKIDSFPFHSTRIYLAPVSYQVLIVHCSRIKIKLRCN